jgi:hypothetical protein
MWRIQLDKLYLDDDVMKFTEEAVENSLEELPQPPTLIQTSILRTVDVYNFLRSKKVDTTQVLKPPTPIGGRGGFQPGAWGQYGAKPTPQVNLKPTNGVIPHNKIIAQNSVKSQPRVRDTLSNITRPNKPHPWNGNRRP